jgi:hypothetical protein
MPPRDAKPCPALERALPGDSGIFDGYRDDQSPWRFLFGDGEWGLVSVRAWWNDRHGRQVVQVEWSADGSTWGESYIVDRGRMRDGDIA